MIGLLIAAHSLTWPVYIPEPGVELIGYVAWAQDPVRASGLIAPDDELRFTIEGDHIGCWRVNAIVRTWGPYHVYMHERGEYRVLFCFEAHNGPE